MGIWSSNLSPPYSSGAILKSAASHWCYLYCEILARVLRTLGGLVCSWRWKSSLLSANSHLWEHLAGHNHGKSPLLAIAFSDRNLKPLQRGWVPHRPTQSSSGPFVDTWLCRAELHRLGWAKSRGKSRKREFTWLSWVWIPERLNLNINITYFLPRMYFLATDWSVNPLFYSPPFSKTPKLLRVISRDTIFTVPL